MLFLMALTPARWSFVQTSDDSECSSSCLQSAKRILMELGSPKCIRFFLQNRWWPGTFGSCRQLALATVAPEPWVLKFCPFWATFKQNRRQLWLTSCSVNANSTNMELLFHCASLRSTQWKLVTWTWHWSAASSWYSSHHSAASCSCFCILPSSLANCW